MKHCFKRWGCHNCNSPYTTLWSAEEHLFIRVEKVFLTNDRGVARDCKARIEDPTLLPQFMQPTSIGFEAWIVEPGETKCNMWTFHIKGDNEVYGRPCGASASSYRPPGTTKRRKAGEWYLTPWVPKEAIESCIKLYVKV